MCKAFQPRRSPHSSLESNTHKFNCQIDIYKYIWELHIYFKILVLPLKPSVFCTLGKSAKIHYAPQARELGIILTYFPLHFHIQFLVTATSKICSKHIPPFCSPVSFHLYFSMVSQVVFQMKLKRKIKTQTPIVVSSTLHDLALSLSLQNWICDIPSS